MTSLSLAAYFGHPNMVHYLAEELGADINIADNAGRTPLYVGALQGHPAVVRVLLKLRADINQSDKEGMTPLMVASLQKHHEVVTWLVKAGADT